MTVEAYPLHWPENWPRTSANLIAESKFETSFAKARDSLFKEVTRLGGHHVVLSCNVPLRNDGLPYAKFAEPEDSGVAVYFEYDGQPMCFACDKFWYVRENMQAIAKTIEALRGIERWGASDMMQRAFSGFLQLPAPGQSKVRSWREVLGIPEGINDLDYIKHTYRVKVRKCHPDRGGSDDDMAELNRAWEQAQEALGR